MLCTEIVSEKSSKRATETISSIRTPPNRTEEWALRLRVKMRRSAVDNRSVCTATTLENVDRLVVHRRDERQDRRDSPLTEKFG